MIQARRGNQRRAGRRRRRRLGRADAHRPAAVPPAASRSTGRSRSTSGASTRTKGARSCSTTSSATRRRSRAASTSCWSARPVMPVPKHHRIHHLGFLSGRGQVRCAGGRRSADHAVVLREPVDGRARGVGARPSGARQRPLRRAEGPVHPQRRRASTTRATRSSRRRCIRSSRTVRCTRGSAGTAASISRATTPGR